MTHNIHWEPFRRSTSIHLSDEMKRYGELLHPHPEMIQLIFGHRTKTKQIQKKIKSVHKIREQCKRFIIRNLRSFCFAVIMLYQFPVGTFCVTTKNTFTLYHSIIIGSIRKVNRFPIGLNVFNRRFISIVCSYA